VSSVLALAASTSWHAISKRPSDAALMRKLFVSFRTLSTSSCPLARFNSTKRASSTSTAGGFGSTAVAPGGATDDNAAANRPFAQARESESATARRN